MVHYASDLILSAAGTHRSGVIEVIDVPKPRAMTDYGKINFATEVAFTSLVDQAKRLGLPVDPVVGLMYLPVQSV